MTSPAIDAILLQIVDEAKRTLTATTSLADLDQAKARYLGKAGSLTELSKGVAKLPVEERPTSGAAINKAKGKVEELLQSHRDSLLARELDSRLAAEAIDVTLPGRRQGAGGLHPITRAQEQVEKLFASMGFAVADGPEIEDDFHNFTALRMFPDHPSRSMQDTFYVEGGERVLRTHTSPVQIRYMKAHPPPVRIICPGRVYRVDHDATHSPMFHQVEGLWVDAGISLADLKGTITQFCRAFFERDDINVRFRPSYFPFVEPGVEIDMEWSRKDGEVSYLEIAGAGVVHPDVLSGVGIDPQKYSGFAFGMGLDRLAMLKYGVNDLRLFFENDMKFLGAIPMKVSLQWLRELVDIGDMPVDKLANALTMGGLEVEEITPVAAAFSGIVVGHVKSVAPHPNADKLRVTQVDAGTGELLNIVCGAPNVAEGQKVPCALIGAKLPGLEIKKAKLRGIESSGMLCSARELGLSQDHEGLLVLEADAPVGRDVREVLSLDDTYLTLKLTPNRGDCLSMHGIARDLAAILGRRLTLPPAAAVPAAITDTRAISISEPRACGQYYGRVIRGIDARARTPGWMVRRLERAGLRSISPLVDITNYVMLERGQPMHAFDHAKLRGAVGVRYMAAGEKVKLLNDQEVAFRQGLLAITDESGPVALGGVMGGHATMVGDDTVDVFFEAAYFDPLVVQGKARDLALTSDAAYRYERGVDPAGTAPAMERATALTLEICGGKAGPVSEARGELPRRAPIVLRPARVRELLGYEVADTEMRAVLERLSCRVEGTGAQSSVTAPSWRFDIAIEEDLVEEVARIHGYEHVPSTPPRSALPMLPLREGARSRFDLRHLLGDMGYQEVINYSFVAAEWERDFAGNERPVRLANPIASHMSVMRTSLLGGLVQSLRANLNRGEQWVRVFEIGRCFEGTTPDVKVQPERIAGLAYGPRAPEQWGQAAAGVDFFDVKGAVEALGAGLDLEFAAASHPACHPGRCALVKLAGRPLGVVGELHPRLQQVYELPNPAVVFELLTAPLLDRALPRFKGVSRMPVVRRDYSFSVAENTPVGTILEAVRKGVPGWVREVEVFDQYRGEGVEAGRKSLALRIVMQDTDRTLTDSEVEAVMASVREQINEEFQAKPRT